MKSIPSYWILLILLISFVARSQAQTTFKAQILDAQTEQAIAGVNLTITESSQGAISEEAGWFDIQILKFPVEIRVSHIAYKEQKLLIEHAVDFPEQIYLHPAISVLEEVVVSSGKKKHSLSNIRNCSVLDFTITESKLIWLEYYGSFSNRNLILADLKGQVFDTLVLNKVRKAETLYRSCTDAIYLKAASKAYRIDIEKDQLLLGSAIDVDSFEQLIKPCQLIQEEKIYYLFSRYNEMLKEVKSYDPRTTEVELLRVVANADQLENYRNDIPMITRGKRLEPMKTKVRTLAENKKLRNLQSESHFLSNVFYKPEYPVYLFAWKNKLLLANHPEKQLEIYKDNRLEKTVPIEYPSNKHWLKRLVYDQKTKKIYALFKYRGKLLLKQVHPEDGTVGEGFIVEASTHGTLELWGDEIFYLKKHPYEQNRSELIREFLYFNE